MKRFFFLLAMLASVATSAQSGVTVKSVSANYGNKTVTFTVSWLNSSRTGTHYSKVWVWVDYIPVVGNATTGSWTRALISGTPTATQGTSTRETGNDNGFWLQGTSGTSGTYNATITVKLNITAAKFNWCAYVSDYPPNVSNINNGIYTFKGTAPFIVNGTTTLPLGQTTYTGTLTALTDRTGCPGLICGKNGMPTCANGCDAGLTIANGKCIALTNTACNAVNIIEIQTASIDNLLYGGRNACSSGWRIPTFAEYLCMNAEKSAIGWDPMISALWWSSSTSGWTTTAVGDGSCCSYAFTGSGWSSCTAGTTCRIGPTRQDIDRGQ
jgi:hypothetical protein